MKSSTSKLGLREFLIITILKNTKNDFLNDKYVSTTHILKFPGLFISMDQSFVYYLIDNIFVPAFFSDQDNHNYIDHATSTELCVERIPMKLLPCCWLGYILFLCCFHEIGYR